MTTDDSPPQPDIDLLLAAVLGDLVPKQPSDPPHLRGCLLNHDPAGPVLCVPRWQYIGTPNATDIERPWVLPVLRAHLVHEIDSAAAHHHGERPFTMFDPTVPAGFKLAQLLLDIAEVSTPGAEPLVLRASLIQLAADAASWAQSLTEREKGISY